ncbi:SMP-30/gluconolactonase/LRE family protein [Rhodocytophaga aerolata]|uniref:SMP-30/gluconolactonase/LRE family protein n=1 Tax=Rhodocytophaga aerolata TaxID=455078 RepID=A0ABT8RGE5_9BACT|nr:SMP-30/gluconolactonase/LRE family protein [Rhodocytophaga aerolata]MDO1450414.1 SMP-30/gluconolactonase/LRE family protein [Rhodocytophaga aerolata]
MYPKIRLLKAIVCLLLSSCTFFSQGQDLAADNPFMYYEQAMQAYAAKNYSLYAENLSKVVDPQSKQPALLYQLAGAYTLTGKHKEASTILNKLAAMGLAYPISTDPDFESFRKSALFAQAKKAFDKNVFSKYSSTQAFVISEKDLVLEGITYDAQQEQWFVGSIYKRKIIRLDAQGKASDFTTEGQEGLLGVLGMKVDVANRVLWVCNAALGGDTSGNSAIFKYDLTNQKLLKKYLLPGGQQKQLLNDLVILKNGDVYATNSEAGAVYKIPKATDQLEIFIKPGIFIYPNGIALSPDGSKLYIAHFAGISVADLSKGTSAEMTHPENTTIAGIDGLSVYDNSLIGVQNGVMPQRIIQMHLNPTYNGLTKVDVLEANHPLFEKIPTTGVVVGNAFYFIANSQLRSMDEQGNILPLDQLQETVILKLTLKK